ncbi:sigma-54 dependent transcriptional regulator [uncultured Roseovarius sp.]|uniref:sigma-54 interaction domain-containing protein n=1 Tax=uncultured Roseovarius sp. TaxID=293344 RepID=UPI000C4E10F3|nr:AAA family ATPase [Roseovarius sp.]MBD12997.1 AAA family ATPase [Roseovarius sp.]|tara:strand:+ start:3419 stop:4555 length:1137 start_codon:yes stop_codon:yes gene_type:complete
MADICITAANFPQAQALKALLDGRRLNVRIGYQPTCHTLVQGAPVTDQRALVELARKLGAKRIVVIEGQAAEFALREDLGGRMLTVSLPDSGLPALRDAALMAVADLLAAPFGTMVAADPNSGALIDMARRVARFDVSVFINGPTGSGKEVLSRLIHAASPRADKPFVAINCAAIPENMLEALLFGHEKGAFTGANTANKGYLRAADGGTLLLDEISEMPMALQAKLLRVIQEKVVTPLGSQTEAAVDVRILATSNRDMEAEIARGTFREDLYYRLNVFPLETLALSARPQDVPVLAQAMLLRHTPEGLPTPLLSPEACDILAGHSWPGNVRELENVMQRALVLADGMVIAPEHIMLVARPTSLSAAFPTAVFASLAA